MKNRSRAEQLALITSEVALFGIVIALLLYGFLADFTHRGDSLPYLKSLIRNPSHAPVEYYLAREKVILSRMILLVMGAQLLLVGLLLRDRTLGVLKAFWTASAHPINLAVFRITIFGTLLVMTNVPRTVWFSQIPKELLFAPPGLAGLLHILPINGVWAAISSRLLLLFCVTGIIGLFSRTSAFLAMITSFYVLGLPQFFGKVNHYHHMLWFLAILAVSRCGDVFSCDAILAARKRADQGRTDPPPASRAYALPLRFVWLLIGVIYFFPGFWKLWNGGLDWALSDNLKFQMYSQWMQFDGWTPFFRIDHYPALYKLLGLGTIAFEMSFIFLVFFPRLRVLAALGGVVFHGLIQVFMRIVIFLSLVACYVAFFDWNAIFRRVGRGLFKEEMYVLYDGNCKFCRRTIAPLRAFDILGRVNYVNTLDKEALGKGGLLWPDATALTNDLCAVVPRKRWVGFAAYRALAARIPALWVVLPFLYLWPIPKVGNRIYRHAADSRSCNSLDERPLRGVEIAYGPSLRARGAIAVGVLLLVANILCGVFAVGNGWPFACYPTFEWIEGPEISSLEISASDSTGESIPLQGLQLSRRFSPDRLHGLIQHILSNSEAAQVQPRLKAFWRLWAQQDADLQQAASVRFYKVTLVIVPERRMENPIHRELLFEWKLQRNRNAKGR